MLIENVPFTHSLIKSKLNSFASPKVCTMFLKCTLTSRTFEPFCCDVDGDDTWLKFNFDKSRVMSLVKKLMNKHAPSDKVNNGTTEKLAHTKKPISIHQTVR